MDRRAKPVKIDPVVELYTSYNSWSIISTTQIRSGSSMERFSDSFGTSVAVSAWFEVQRSLTTKLPLQTALKYCDRVLNLMFESAMFMGQKFFHLQDPVDWESFASSNNREVGAFAGLVYAVMVSQLSSITVQATY